MIIPNLRIIYRCNLSMTRFGLEWLDTMFCGGESRLKLSQFDSALEHLFHIYDIWFDVQTLMRLVDVSLSPSFRDDGSRCHFLKRGGSTER